MRARLRLAEAVVLITTPFVLLALLVVEGRRSDDLAVDLVDAFLPAGAAVLDGRSPYPSPADPVVAAGAAYVFPPPLAILLAPVSALPREVIAVAAVLVLTTVVVATLLVLGVRDWRCHAVALSWAPVFAAIQTANVTLLLGLGAAIAWRYRFSDRLSGAALGATLALKLFLWPLVVWQCAIRRQRAGVLSVLVGATLALAGWAFIGFAGFAAYPSLLRELSRLEAPVSYTIYAIGLDLGLSRTAASALWLGGGLALLAAVIRFGRSGDDRRSYCAALLAALALSPIVWMHYFALLLVPIAVRSPRLEWTWFLPLLFWVGAGTKNGDPWQTIAVTAVAAVIGAVVVGRQPREITATALSR